FGAGTHPITAVYTGSAGFAASHSAVAFEAVGTAAATVTVSGPTSVAARDPAPFTATAAAQSPPARAPHGAVCFFAQGYSNRSPVFLGGPPLAGGPATLPPSGLAAGYQYAPAVYGGNAPFANAPSPPPAVNVTQTSTTTTVTPSAASAPPGQVVTFTATV